MLAVFRRLQQFSSPGRASFAEYAPAGQAGRHAMQETHLFSSNTGGLLGWIAPTGQISKQSEQEE
jgi:hypothetical protein